MDLFLNSAMEQVKQVKGTICERTKGLRIESGARRGPAACEHTKVRWKLFHTAS